MLDKSSLLLLRRACLMLVRAIERVLAEHYDWHASRRS